MAVTTALTGRAVLLPSDNATLYEAHLRASREAWRVYRLCLPMNRIQFAPEPFTLEQEWRKVTMQPRPTPKICTDAYLIAFARAAAMQFVTLDRAVLAIGTEALLLEQGCCGRDNVRFAFTRRVEFQRDPHA